MNAGRWSNARSASDNASSLICAADSRDDALNAPASTSASCSGRITWLKSRGKASTIRCTASTGETVLKISTLIVSHNAFLPSIVACQV